MNATELELWKRIEGFSLDDAKAALPFSVRLARENGWSREYARRVIDEYKRFIFLGCVAGHGVTPSEDVDQVWHLHLAYTRSYWKEFCAGVLGKPFHHEPTTGGAEEAEKFGGWHGKTLESYRKFFEEEAPLDIWPRRGEHRELQWVDRKANWVIQKPRRAAVAAGLGFCLTLLAVGCVEMALANPFDMMGPAFLNFYWMFALIVLAGAALWRRTLESGLRLETIDTTAPDAFEVAYLAGRGPLATNAAIAGLLDRKILDTSDASKLKVAATVDGNELSVLERAILTGTKEGDVLKPMQARGKACKYFPALHEKLAARGLVFGAGQARSVLLGPLLLALSVPVVGAVKIGVGISRNRPVMFLLFATIVALIGVIAYFGRRPFATVEGKKLLEKLKVENANLTNPPAAAGLGAASLMPMAVALYGLSVLEQTPYARHRKILEQQQAAGASCGTSSGSSCGGGGSSSSGGSGCGGCGGGGGD